MRTKASMEDGLLPEAGEVRAVDGPRWKPCFDSLRAKGLRKSKESDSLNRVLLLSPPACPKIGRGQVFGIENHLLEWRPGPWRHSRNGVKQGSAGLLGSG